MQINPYSADVEARSVRHRIRGIDYHVNEWGHPSDPLLIMLHGWGDAGSTFQFVVDALSEDRFVIAPDWRGFGESAHAGPAYWFPDYIADLDALINIYSAEHSVVLLGHSMGANVAALYAGVFPDRVTAVINVEGFGLADRNPDEAPLNYRSWIERSRRPQAYSSYASFDELAKRILKRSPNMPEDRALFAAMQWGRENVDGKVVIKADPAHKLPNAVLYRRAESAACWRAVSAPVLMLVGAMSEFRDGAKPWLDENPAAAGFAESTLVTIEDAGHMIHFEQPEALAGETEAFLASYGL